MTPSPDILTLGDLRVAYVRTGPPSSSPIVFLHGLGDSAIITFLPFAAHPALNGAPALALDLPGFGFSTAPASWPSTTEDQAAAVAAALDALGVHRAPVVAHSMGGSVAILLAERRPGLVERLVLAEPLLRPEHSQLARSIAKRSEEAFVARGMEMLKLATRRQANRGDNAARGFQAPLERANAAVTYRAAVSLVQERSPAFQEVLARLPHPRTVLVGERTVVDTREIEAAGVRLVRIPRAGHSMMTENPEAFAAAVAWALQPVVEDH
jgi:pimeloyl-ACP methyl ester carboxylesterase